MRTGALQPRLDEVERLADRRGPLQRADRRGAHEAAFDHELHLRAQRGVEAVDVQRHHRLGVHAERARHPHLEQLLERAEAAGQRRKASLRESISPLRARMSSTTSSSSASRSATSRSSSADGMTPTVCAPPARAERATAPIDDRSPPPLTSEWPRRASSAPTSAASWTCEASIRVLDAQ
jgi:hypothetical protein